MKQYTNQYGAIVYKNDSFKAQEAIPTTLRTGSKNFTKVQDALNNPDIESVWQKEGKFYCHWLNGVTEKI